MTEGRRGTEPFICNGDDVLIDIRNPVIYNDHIYVPGVKSR